MIDRRQVLIGGGGLAALSLAPLGLARAQGGQAVHGVYSAPGLSFAGIFIANQLGLWGKNGLAAELKQVQGGPLAMAALTNKEADFAGVASSDPMIGWDKGIKTLTIAAFTGAIAMQFTARKDWMAKVGVSPSSTLKDKVAAFAKARLGASTVGGGPAQYTRYLAHSMGLDPDRDLKILAVGFGAPRMAALRTNQVDITVGDAPEADQIELEGFGQLFINCSQEVPVFRECPYTVVAVSPDYAERQPDLCRRVAHAVGEANDQFRSNFGKVVDVMAKVFPSVDRRAIERALDRDRASYPPGGRMTETMWRNLIEISVALKMISKSFPSADGVLWTNKFAS